MSPLISRMALRIDPRALAVVALLFGLGLARAEAVSAEPAALANDMLGRVNRVRADNGLPPLSEAVELDAVAFDRSADMAGRHYFSHTTPDGLTVFNLIEQRGLSYRLAGENLAWNTYAEGQAGAVAVRGFLDSPPHRANLLNPAFSQIGVGVATDGSKTFFTLVFIG